jgi:hypothetical protein
MEKLSILCFNKYNDPLYAVNKNKALNINIFDDQCISIGFCKFLTFNKLLNITFNFIFYSIFILSIFC